MVLSAIRQVFGAPTFDAENLLPPMVTVDNLPSAYGGQKSYDPYEYSVWDGGKFDGGFGATQLWHTDYWTLRRRSAQLFKENLYARGLIRRLITNEINTGLTPECAPDARILGVDEDNLAEWTEEAENRFDMYAHTFSACDWKNRETFGEIQRTVRMEALIEGDVLVVMRMNRKTNTPAVQLIRGSHVATPLGHMHTENGVERKIEHGVEMDAQGRHVAYWVRQKDGEFKRLPAYGERSGRRLAWLVYGTEKRLDDVRGEPLLSLMLQALKEVDRYRDAAMRKAVVTSIATMWIKRTQEESPSRSISKSAVRTNEVSALDTNSASTRKIRISEMLPGSVLQELGIGEELEMTGGQGTDINFRDFEQAIIAGIAWANQIPPEILTLAFSNNYSASQAAINEFKIYLHMMWDSFGKQFCQPVFVEWLVNESLVGRFITTGLVAVWRDPMRHPEFAAWTRTLWYGSIKPSTDMQKQSKGSKMLVDEGWSTNAREARQLTGTKFTRNIATLRRENQLKADAMQPLVEVAAAMRGSGANEAADAVEAAVIDYLEINGGL